MLNQSSSSQTGVVGGIGAALIAVLDWILNTIYKLNVPPVVLASMSALILAAVHQASNIIAARNTDIVKAVSPIISATSAMNSAPSGSDGL